MNVFTLVLVYLVLFCFFIWHYICEKWDLEAVVWSGFRKSDLKGSSNKLEQFDLEISAQGDFDGLATS